MFSSILNTHTQASLRTTNAQHCENKSVNNRPFMLIFPVLGLNIKPTSHHDKHAKGNRWGSVLFLETVWLQEVVQICNLNGNCDEKIGGQDTSESGFMCSTFKPVSTQWARHCGCSHEGVSTQTRPQHTRCALIHYIQICWGVVSWAWHLCMHLLALVGSDWSMKMSGWLDRWGRWKMACTACPFGVIMKNAFFCL